jgi:hypothetical protein
MDTSKNNERLNSCLKKTIIGVLVMLDIWKTTLNQERGGFVYRTYKILSGH